MDALSKAELLRQLEASHVAYQQMEQRAEALSAQLTAVKPRRFDAADVQSVNAAAHDGYVAACAAAREMARRTGRSVKVG